MSVHRASQVDIKKLEKAEAKIKVLLWLHQNGSATRPELLAIFRPRLKNVPAEICMRDPSLSTCKRNRYVASTLIDHYQLLLIAWCSCIANI